MVADCILAECQPSALLDADRAMRRILRKRGRAQGFQYSSAPANATVAMQAKQPHHSYLWHWLRAFAESPRTQQLGVHAIRLPRGCNQNRSPQNFLFKKSEKALRAPGQARLFAFGPEGEAHSARPRPAHLNLGRGHYVKNPARPQVRVSNRGSWASSRWASRRCFFGVGRCAMLGFDHTRSAVIAGLSLSPGHAVADFAESLWSGARTFTHVKRRIRAIRMWDARKRKAIPL